MSATLFEPEVLAHFEPARAAPAAPVAQITGIPDPLPPSETIVWQGKPAFWSLARHLCHVQVVALYFGVVGAGTAAAAALYGSTVGQIGLTLLLPVIAATVALGVLVLMAWLISRTTEYTLTTRRLVIRSGVALPAVLTIPYGVIASAAVTLHRDQTGDLPMAMKPGHHMALHRVWPHSRPFQYQEPQPMLRSVPRAGHVATLLAAALAEAQREALTS